MVSIIMPTMRPDMAVERLCDFVALHALEQWELIIPTPLDESVTRNTVLVDGPAVRIIREDAPRGPLAAHRRALADVRGEYILYWSDAARPQHGSLEAFVRDCDAHQAPYVSAWRLFNDAGEELPQWEVYGKPYACWGGLSYVSLAKLDGVLFDPRYRAFWGDPDLGLRVWEAGGRVGVNPTASCTLLPHDHTPNWERYFESDRLAFVNKWHPIYAKRDPEKWAAIDPEDWQSYNTSYHL